MDGQSVVLDECSGAKALVFHSLNVAAEAATHNDHA